MKKLILILLCAAPLVGHCAVNEFLLDKEIVIRNFHTPSLITNDSGLVSTQWNAVMIMETNVVTAEGVRKLLTAAEQAAPEGKAKGIVMLIGLGIAAYASWVNRRNKKKSGGIIGDLEVVNGVLMDNIDHARVVIRQFSAIGDTREKAFTDSIKEHQAKRGVLGLVSKQLMKRKYANDPS